MTEPIITRAMVGRVRPLTFPRHLPAPSRRWTGAEWDLVRRGHLSGSEHGWNALVEHGRLFFHRRGSGACIYEAQFSRVADDAWMITELVMTGDEDIHRVDGATIHALHVEALIDTLLLGAHDTRAVTALRSGATAPAPA